ncbi:hypothetical protein FB451DRAFT_1223321 [Mycena latifolia]|nr:hypothetical protein FB451DRAFT_1223321 [Mycena latifolia]
MACSACAILCLIELLPVQQVSELYASDMKAVNHIVTHADRKRLRTSSRILWAKVSFLTTGLCDVVSDYEQISFPQHATNTNDRWV